ncbi:MAG: methyltransferase domain-containing protein [candidate division Zixibacteria bacterium]|nr:methyltransferase domain-containing protein [candidate division Zixibacteria bacterium]
MLRAAMKLAENGYIPDSINRIAIRRLLARRLSRESSASKTDRENRMATMVEEIKKSPIALVPDKANEQHYEVPAPFFELVLGKHLKYSAGYWPEGINNLDDSEAAMLELTCQRAGLKDGQEILELGCGWGSLTLWMAEHYPGSSITAVSNSNSQREFIEKRAGERGLDNLRIITRDMNDFDIDQKFDRVVSVEMFEHMRNYEQLMRKISGWLKADGKLFVHIFCHREYAYPFEDRGEGDWMARHFFTGGLMPSADLLTKFQDDIKLEQQWKVNGMHYARTCHTWINQMDKHRPEIMNIFAGVYGEDNARMWYGRWKLFFMACEELFAFKRGDEWYVAHYLFGK